MINFYLPDFYFLYDANIKFIEYMQDNPEKFREDVSIGALYGSFPGMIWNGGRVNNLLAGFSNYDNIQGTIKSINSYGVAIRLTTTNLLITEDHLNDIFCNKVLDVAARNEMNEILVANDTLEEYVREKYPTLKIISSTTKCIYDKALLEKELEKDYHLVVPSIKFNNTEELFNISNPKKCEILVNNVCDQNCKFEKLHYLQMSKNNAYMNTTRDMFHHGDLNFTCKSPYKKLDPVELLKQNSACIDVDSLYNIYVKKGFEHFKLAGRTDGPNRALFFYVYYMVKPEYQMEALSYLLLSE